MLSFLPENFTAVVIGANGGIGNAMVDALLTNSQVGRIVAVSRSPVRLNRPNVESVIADVSISLGREVLSQHLDGRPVHLLFNATGILHDSANGIQPEKRLEQLNETSIAHVMHINAVMPALLLSSLKSCLQGKHPAIIASLSARVGSIGDNGYGGWYSYRASKAAHNMLMRTAAIEISRLNKQSIVLCLHPGTTDTTLSKPFQARVPKEKLFTPAFVAEHLLAVMDQRTPEDSGSFWDWNGKSIEW
ncbi:MULTISPECIES: SDR family NAD(P)-dependent oxidoreductase [unclassified Halomonas]|uniref:SDR family NAD(P)-dependent oxidoreductase n=1 Tax=unclassified Halomonas TaxID=2609666 RepID=UPI0007F11F24|nr:MULTISPECIES: SDR family NAD(P)-dependent oxidoreductase [unclassified Halomonas]SBR52407.1 NAD(P)-dependent dehydrogenase, short-chain alcohol dehydrogenase family [Halomonas sp. HL-93]SNY98026.1 NAD(P)-dependent dehydrogenase, short-chain alcohol dehydrogenase family [Halomonas sp. hl-4]